MKEAAEEDYVYLPDGKDDTDQEVLRAAMESISLSAENRIDSGKQRRKAREALTEVYAAKPGLQSLPFSHNDDCHECHEGHGHDGNGALESAHYGIATATLPDYDGQRVPGNYVAASEEHILPTPSTYDLAVPANYIVTAPPIDLATTSSYVEPCRITNYNEPLPLDYVTSAPLTNLATASAYVEPVASDQIFATPPGDVGVAFSNNASIAPIFYGNTLPVGYGAIASSNYDASLPLGFSTTVP
ncbi:hypothetical protein TRIATDRAFT_297127, partial [Trichoderma atroviride IMI 206040]